MITIKDAEEILKKEYHIDNFLYLINDILLPDFKSDKHDVVFKNSIFAGVTQLGNSATCDVTIYEVILKPGVEKRRVTITQEMFRILRGQGVNNAVVAFANADRNNYRISLLTSKYEFSGDKIVKVISNPRRYSYALGYGTKTKTAYKFLIEKGKANSLEELTARFSVEVVNKQFYSEIAICFTELVGGDRDGRHYDRQLNLYGVTNHNKYSEFAVRLIGRIVFCWFLKEKKSESGLSLLPEQLISLDGITDNYYHTVLEPLFFELLNTNGNRRKGKYAEEELYQQIPYLNGGLFSPHTDDMYKYDRVNQCGTFGIVTIPDEWFRHFYGVLSQYNFTVDENTSYDIELSIDPEMLGRIFENLLAEINPETGENAKKSTGSFYTPRDIVDYMVDNSILEYLKTRTGIDDSRLKALISYAKEDDELAEFNNAEKKAIINALYTVTVLDPACGSGAFPIGMLQKIVYILQQVDPEANLWFDKATENVSILIKKEFEKKFNAGSLDYIRKLSVIQNSIFGVDIQPIAVEIARLRCFLSLVIEEKVYDDEPNRGINPLPNLDFKFVIANSLLDLESGKKAYQYSVFENQEHIKKLQEIRELYFRATDLDEKKDLISDFKDVQQSMLLTTISNYNKTATQKYQSLSEWKPFSNESTDWFNPEWMFGVKDGFDIIIANPPYVESRSSNFSETLKDKLQAQIKNYYNKQTACLIARGADLLIYFLEAAIRFIKDTGIISFITSNGWLNNEYGHKFQKFLLANTSVISVIDTDFKYFESANINTIITFFRGKSPTRNNICFVTHHRKYADAAMGIEFACCDNADIRVTQKVNDGDNSLKWGVYFSSDANFFTLLNILKQKGKTIDKVGFCLGQGLNLIDRDSHIIHDQDITSLGLQYGNVIPFCNKDELGQFVWTKSNTYLIDEITLDSQQMQQLSNSNVELFNRYATRKDSPKLIMPRGIGERHFCTLNKIKGYSDSCVDIYNKSNSNYDDLLRIWLFCNSTICWLIREKFGRKNLGGGLLKAEAVDLKEIPLYFNFDKIDEIKHLTELYGDRKAKNALEELNEGMHKKIDILVFDYLNLSEQMKTYVINEFTFLISDRTQKSKRKA